MLKGKLIEEITKKSIGLEKYGLNDLAWSKEDAQNLINLLMTEKIGILGGDVYQLTSYSFRPLGDNWSCEYNYNELIDDYYLRSKIESLKYINNYPVSDEEGIIFSITFTEQITRLRDAEPSITAVRLDDHWLFCPNCLDAWESDSREPKVICPKCDQIFLNPIQRVE
jgi:hypothetical protein